MLLPREVNDELISFAGSHDQLRQERSVAHAECQLALRILGEAAEEDLL